MEKTWLEVSSTMTAGQLFGVAATMIAFGVMLFLIFVGWKRLVD